MSLNRIVAAAQDKEMDHAMKADEYATFRRIYKELLEEDDHLFLQEMNSYPIDKSDIKKLISYRKRILGRIED